MTALFRTEALEGQRQSWLGSIRLIRPLPMLLLTAFVVSVAALTVAYLFLGEYTRKTTVSGVLVPDLSSIPLLSPQLATVFQTLAYEGQVIKEGEPLFVLSADLATPSGDTPAAAQQRLSARDSSLTAPTHKALEAPENNARQRIVIRAPQDGVLGAVMAEPGQHVSASTVLASLMPARARLQAQLYAPAHAIGFLREDQTVLLRYRALPHQKFGHHPGQVLHVSRTPLPAGEPPGPSLSAADTGAGADAFGGRLDPGGPLYRVTVALGEQAVSANGQALPLAAGMRLDADVMLDRRHLIEWLFEPVRGLAGRA